MKRYLALLSIISTTLISANLNMLNADDIKYKGNAYRVFNECSINKSKDDKFDDFWTPKNEGYLNEVQKNKLNTLREKASSDNTLTITDYNELKIMKSEVIRSKLGDEKFKELEKLVNKREGTLDLTLPERQRLYELNKEARE